MSDIFLRIVELSWQAGVLALVVMAARLALRRAPKWAVCLLWALVAVRLVLPQDLAQPQLAVKYLRRFQPHLLLPQVYSISPLAHSLTY